MRTLASLHSMFVLNRTSNPKNVKPIGTLARATEQKEKFTKNKLLREI